MNNLHKFLHLNCYNVKWDTTHEILHAENKQRISLKIKLLSIRLKLLPRDVTWWRQIRQLFKRLLVSPLKNQWAHIADDRGWGKANAPANLHEKFKVQAKTMINKKPHGLNGWHLLILLEKVVFRWLVEFEKLALGLKKLLYLLSEWMWLWASWLEVKLHLM